ncbi:MAG: PDZ domain-containing protein [Clostridia bacterium]|nr:PDZ domain-containing protein [Clostridia bacterium]
MRNRRPGWLLTILLCVAVAAVSIGGTWYVTSSGYRKDNMGEDLSRYAKLNEIQKLLDEHYVGEYDEDEARDILSAAMLAGINDRWAYYTAAEDVQALTEDRSGSYSGIGVTVVQDADTGLLRITVVNEGSPAEEAGLQVLDQIYAVEGQLVSEIGMDATVALVRGEIGTKVNMAIIRNGIIYNFEVERAVVEQQSVKAEVLDGNVGYIRINSFTTVAASQFAQKLNTLLGLGVDSLIIDVRNNGGGSLNTLLSILDMLLPEGVVFIERDAAGNEVRYSTDSAYCDLPIVVLANGYSYSAAEYFAAVLQEKGRAWFIGEPTTGKGEGQSTFTLSDGSCVSFSTIKYFTPAGVSIGAQGGINPDQLVELTNEQLVAIGTVEAENDPQIVAVLEYLAGN